MTDETFVSCFGTEKKEWREREGYFTHDESYRLIKDAANDLVLIEDV